MATRGAPTRDVSSAPTLPQRQSLTLKRRTMSSTPTSRAPLSKLPSIGGMRGPPSKAPSLTSLYSAARMDVVLGSTATGTNGLAVDSHSGAVARLAGSSVVVQRGRGRRALHLHGDRKNVLSAVAFSPCGKFIATGEFGNNPPVRVFDVETREGRIIGTHQHGIVALKFSPGSAPLLVSVGEVHDQSLTVWNWQTGAEVGGAKVTLQVNAIDISPNGSLCISAGQRQLRLFSLDGLAEGKRMQTPHNVLLKNFRNSSFVDVVFLDDDRAVVASRDGAILEVSRKGIVRDISLPSTRIYTLALLHDELLVGCGRGEVMSLSVYSPEWSVRPALIRPHYLGMDVADATTIDNLENHPPGAKYPSVLAMAVHQSTGTVTVVYADSSIYTMQKAEGGRTRKLHSSLSHSGRIHALEVYPSNLPFLPRGSFLTGGSDGTLRVWSLEAGLDGPTSPSCHVPSKNLLSNEIKKILFLDKAASLVTTTGKSAEDELARGVKSLAISHDGRHVVAGMRSGELCIVDLSSPSFPVETIDAHEGDVQALQYSIPDNGCPWLLASGGRDRLIHVLSPSHRYEPVGLIDDHSSSIVSIRFHMTAEGFRMFTCSTDRTIVIRGIDVMDEGLSFSRLNQISCSVAVNDLHVSPDGRGLLTSCQDRQIRYYSLAGKLLNTVKATSGEASSAGNVQCTRMAVDSSATLIASICSDRLVYVVEARTGNPVAVLRGFGDGVSAIAFSEDQRRLLVTSLNGCVFVNRLGERVINRLTAARKALEESTRTPSPDSVLGSGSDTVSDETLNRDLEQTSSHFGSVSSLAREDEDTDSLFSPPVLLHHSVVTPQPSPRREEAEDLELLRPSAPRYHSSKSMSSIRAPPGGASPRRPRKKWDDSSPLHFDPDSSTFSTTLDAMRLSTPPSPAAPPPYAGMQRFPVTRPPMESPPSSFASSASSRFPVSPSSLTPSNNNFTYLGSSSLQSPPPPPSSSSTPRLRETLMAQRQAQLAAASAPSPSSSAASTSSFNRDSPERVSLSKRFQLKKAEKEPRTAWSPSSTASSASRRTTSFMGLGGPANHPIARRQSDLLGGGFRSPLLKSTEKLGVEKTTGIRRSRTMGGGGKETARTAADDDSFSALRSHIRSRSQSPNQLALNGGLNGSMPGGGGLAAYSRKDSEASLTLGVRRTPSRSNLRGLEETRKSSQALDRIANTRKMRQSTENLAEGEGMGRARSIGNLRGNALEIGGAFEVDERPRLGSSGLRPSPLSRLNRNLARSMGQLNGENDEGTRVPSLGSGLLDAMSNLKKASNPDLADLGQYERPPRIEEDVASPAKPRRGAVQKKVERYHPRNRGGGGARESNSGESDSNASDLQPGYGRNGIGSGSRSMDASRAMGRRLVPSAVAAAPRRVPNYLSKINGDGMEGGPDLGSDESPRSSVVNSADWMGQFEGKSGETRKLALHVRTCVDELLMVSDKLRHAMKLVGESDISDDDRLALLEVLSNTRESALSKTRGEGRKSPVEERRKEERPYSGQTRLSSGSSQSSSFSQSMGPRLDANFLSMHGNELLALLQQNMAKQN